MEGILAPVEGGYDHPAGRRVRFVRVTPLDISSTMVRDALGEGRSIRYLVPEGVRFLLEGECLPGHGEEDE